MVDDKAQRNEEFFEEYRRKRAALADKQNEMYALEASARAMRTEICELNQELDQMRRVITAMIEGDLDPVQAKLAGTEEIRDVMWDHTSIHRLNSLSLNDMSQALVTTASQPSWTTTTISPNVFKI